MDQMAIDIKHASAVWQFIDNVSRPDFVEQR
jgi:hypothetical protein